MLMLALGAFAPKAHAQSCAAGETAVPFAFTGGEQTVIVPSGVTSATIHLSGAQGGNGISGNGNAAGFGGRGGRVSGNLSVTPGAVLSVWVGGQGSQAVNPGGLGGLNQGAGTARAGNGGGGTDLRVGGSSIANRVAIAAGGGGGGNAGWGGTNNGAVAGGAGGDSGGSGGAGVDVDSAGSGPFGGGGGAIGIGGAGGGGCGGFPATAGAASGDGGTTRNFSGGFLGNGAGGGGGGGATVGGGGGGAGVGTTACLQNWTGGGGGGAGGASSSGSLSSPVVSNGVQSGDGAALICFAAAGYSFGGTSTGHTGPVTLQLDATNPASTQQTTVAAGATTFSFATPLAPGSNWHISFVTQPAGQACEVTPVSGMNLSANVDLTLTCTTVTTTIDPATLPGATFATAYSQTLTASSTNGGTGPYTFGVTAGSLPAGLTLSSSGLISGTPTATGTFNFTVQATSSNGFSGTRAYSLVVGRAPQSITNFASNPAAPVFATGGTFSVSATPGASSSPVLFGSTTPGVCTVSGTTVTMQAAGSCMLTADQAGDANYEAAPQVQLTVQIGRSAQAITNFAANPASPTYVPGGTFAVSATPGASSSPVVFGSTTPSVCTVTGSTVAMQSAGTCTLTADQAGDASYQAAPQVVLNAQIRAGSQALANFAANPASPTYVPGGTFAVSATPGASSSPVVFGSNTPAVCTVSGSTVAMRSAGSCVLTADQAGDARYAAAAQVVLNVQIGQASQSITNFAANPGAPVYAPNGTFAVSATAGASSSPLVFGSTTPAVCTVAGTTANMVGAGNCRLTANQAGDANYSAAPQVVLDVAIGQAMPTIGWIGALQRTTGEPAFDLPAPTSTSPGAFTYASSNPAVATVSGRTVTIVGPGTTTLTATQAATTNYTAASATTTLQVAARPDPTKDPVVVAGLQAQVDASVRFAAAQQGNIRDRLRQLRATEGRNSSRNGLAVNVSNGSGQGVALPMGGHDADGGWLPQEWGAWTAGTIQVGERDATRASRGFDFRSDGISLGFDRVVGERLVLGIAGGMGWSDADLADDRSELNGKHRSLSAYGLWWPGENVFVDGLLGWGRLDFDINRWSSVANAMALANREGDQRFASLTVGYEHRDVSNTLTGYGRLDTSRTELDAYRESGLGIYDLAYRAQEIDNSTLAVGLEGRYALDWGTKSFRPFWTIEYRDALRNDGDVSVNYVVQPVAGDYLVALRSYNEDLFAFGAGFDLALGSGWRMSMLFRREQASDFSSNSYGLWLSFGGQVRTPARGDRDEPTTDAATGP
ncbi:autotransporter domain-containing protein [Luteimonas vadosa]